MEQLHRIAEQISGNALIAAGTISALVAVSGGFNEWTGRAATMVGTAGVIVTGGLMILNKIDKAWMARTKEWEDFQKESISQKLEESLENQMKMRESLHEMRKSNNVASLENQELRNELTLLRSQFMDISKQLYGADKELHEANVSLRAATATMGDVQDRLEECEKARARMMDELVLLNSRIGAIEDSGEHKPVPDCP